MLGLSVVICFILVMFLLDGHGWAKQFVLDIFMYFKTFVTFRL